MFKLTINTAVIGSLNPCESRFGNWKTHYETFEGDILKFLELGKITDKDKVWVALRILPREIVEVFAIDCAFAASNYADAAAYAADAATYAATYAADAATADAATDAATAATYAATDAAYAAADAAYAAADAAAYVAARKEQVEVLKWLIKDARKAA